MEDERRMIERKNIRVIEWSVATEEDRLIWLGDPGLTIDAIACALDLPDCCDFNEIILCKQNIPLLEALCMVAPKDMETYIKTGQRNSYGYIEHLIRKYGRIKIFRDWARTCDL